MIEPTNPNENPNQPNLPPSSPEASNPWEPPVSSPTNPPAQPPIPPIPTAEISSVPLPEGGSKKWLWVLLVILFILLLPAGLIFATENGYLSLGLDKYYNAVGLERLWKGLPLDGQKALVVVNQKMESASSCHFSGNFTIEGNVSLQNNPQITKVFPQINQERVLGESAETASMNFGLAGDYEKPNKISATATVDISSQEITSLGIPASLTLDFRQVENKIYFKIPALSTLIGSEANKWLMWDLGQYQTGGQEETLKKSAEKLLQAIKSSQRLQGESLAGKSVYHYQFILDKTKLKNLYQDKSFTPTSDPKIDIFIGKKDHLIYKLKVNIDSQTGNSQVNLKGEIKLSDFNKPFNITAPKEEETAKEGLMGLFQGLESSIKARDAKRKSDLGTIKMGLMAYHKDNGSYPVSSEIDKTNNQNGVLAKALVPNYLKSLPVDPQDPEKWYGYKSDGKTFTLWSLLEDKTDPAGKQDGQYFKYILTNE